MQNFSSSFCTYIRVNVIFERKYSVTAKPEKDPNPHYLSRWFCPPDRRWKLGSVSVLKKLGSETPGGTYGTGYSKNENKIYHLNFCKDLEMWATMRTARRGSSSLSPASWIPPRVLSRWALSFSKVTRRTFKLYWSLLEDRLGPSFPRWAFYSRDIFALWGKNNNGKRCLQRGLFSVLGVTRWKYKLRWS
jgi:hypothetical protein